MLETGLREKGIEVGVLSFGAVRRWPPLLRHGVFAIKLWRAARGADVVFSQDPFSCGLPALFAARLRKVSFVVRIPGDYAWEQARERFGITDTVEEFQQNYHGPFLAFLRAAQRFVVRRADAVVTPSRYIGAVVATWGPRVLKVIHNGVDLPARAQTVDAPARPFIATASRLIRGKGFECLIDLMRELPQWRLVIIGAGPLEAQLKKQASESPVADRILFTGAVSREAMFGWYKAATVFVLNTEFETFSFQVAEALASGAPTIATAVGGIPEVLRSGTDGLLVAPNDRVALKKAIESVLLESDIWKSRIAAGRERIKEFSSERSVHGFVELFKELCRR